MSLSKAFANKLKFYEYDLALKNFYYLYFTYACSKYLNKSNFRRYKLELVVFFSENWLKYKSNFDCYAIIKDFFATQDITFKSKVILNVKLISNITIVSDSDNLIDVDSFALQDEVVKNINFNKLKNNLNCFQNLL